MRPVALALVLSLTLLSSCSYTDSEPGLFPPVAPEASEQTDFPPPDGRAGPTNPELPVAGEAVCTSSEGLRLTSRVAVHAVRRMAGATVLDWSITPLEAPGLRRGEAVPSPVDFGLARTTGGDVSAVLLDGAAGRVYRPLQHRNRRTFNHCLCTPLWVAQLDLRIGETRMLQVTFPPLPAGLRRVDVSLATLPVFTGVPVNGIGQLPTAASPTDLLRAAEEPGPLAPPFPVNQSAELGPDQVQTIQIDAIEAGPHFTSVRWTLRSLEDQPSFNSLRPGPPVSGPPPGNLPALHAVTASGPRLRIGDVTLLPLHLTHEMLGRRYTDCLCTAFGLWATALRQAGGRASLTTVYPALPRGTSVADIELPTATTIWRLPVSTAADGGSRLGSSRATRVGTWTYADDRPPAGWGTSDWPTSLPAAAQLRDYEAFVERLLPSSSR